MSKNELPPPSPKSLPPLNQRPATQLDIQNLHDNIANLLSKIQSQDDAIEKLTEIVTRPTTTEEVSAEISVETIRVVIGTLEMYKRLGTTSNQIASYMSKGYVENYDNGYKGLHGNSSWTANQLYALTFIAWLARIGVYPKFGVELYEEYTTQFMTQERVYIYSTRPVLGGRTDGNPFVVVKENDSVPEYIMTHIVLQAGKIRELVEEELHAHGKDIRVSLKTRRANASKIKHG